MKKVDQILKNGKITSDFDQVLTPKELDSLYFSLFRGQVTKDRKQYILFGKVGILTANVTYLGHPHPIYKKRIQLKDYYPEYVCENRKNGLTTLYVGVYTYNRTKLFVVFEPSTYEGKKSHNSSAHVYSMNLQYAQRVGQFSKIDAFGNRIHVFKRDHLVAYVKKTAGIIDLPEETEDIMNLLNGYLGGFVHSLPIEWKGVDSYREMMEKKFSKARGNRWPGWYFEFLFQNYLKDHPTDQIEWNEDKSENGIDLDLIFPKQKWVYGDAKADQINEDILGNDFDAFEKVITEHNGTVYYICALYNAEKDSDHGYQVSQYWNSLRDANKAYTSIDELKKRAGKSMKYSVKMQSINVLKIDKDAYEILKETPFFQGVNSNGKPRAPKLKVKKDMIAAMSVIEYRF